MIDGATEPAGEPNPYAPPDAGLDAAPTTAEEKTRRELLDVGRRVRAVGVLTILVAIALVVWGVGDAYQRESLHANSLYTVALFGVIIFCGWRFVTLRGGAGGFLLVTTAIAAFAVWQSGYTVRAVAVILSPGLPLVWVRGRSASRVCLEAYRSRVVRATKHLARAPVWGAVGSGTVLAAITGLLYAVAALLG